MSRSLLLLIVAASTLASGQRYSGEVDRFVGNLMQKRGVPGLSLAVVRNGKIEYAKGYGFADLENDVRATPETVYQVGSITKQFTAAVVMQLVQEGKVNLDERARIYLPEMPEAWKEVTVRQLLTHTSGIKSYTGIPEFFPKAVSPIDGKGFLAFVATQPFDFKPGDDWSYNNTGYFLLGMLIEKVTGKSYTAAMSERIFKPLNMTSTFINDGSTLVKHRAKGYDPDVKNGPRNTAYIDMSWPYSAGAIVSTVLDLAKWDAALYGSRIMNDASRQESWTPVKLNSGKTFPYGFGWGISKRVGVDVVEHGGDINGFNAHIFRFPGKKLTVIALCNSNPGITTLVCNTVAGMAEPSLKKPVPQPIKDTDAKLTAAHKKLLESALAGTIDRDLFTDQMKAILTPERIAGVRDRFASLGSLENFVLVKDEKTATGVHVRVYGILVGGEAFNVTIGTLPDGKIAGFTIGRDD